MNKVLIASVLFSTFLVMHCKEVKQSTDSISSEPSELKMHSVSIGKDSTMLYLPSDLTATLWAESPMLYNPTNMDVDYKGRIWVTEAVNYRDFNPHSKNRMHQNNGDRVVILEDSNDDGIADKTKVFVQDTDLVAPLGIAVIGNRVIVSCSPNLIMYTDENGDDVPDKKEIVLTGFGGFDHDHSLHSVVAGPDGLWYFNTGNAGPHRVKDKNGWMLRSGSMYTGGTPYNTTNEGNLRSDDGRVWVGGLSLRMNNESKDLKVMAQGFRNSYEVIIDSYGNLWQNDNDDQVMACRTSYILEGGNAGFFSNDGTRSWQADRRPWQDLFTAHWHQDDPGIMPVSDNAGAGSPTGMAINESDALGEKYLGMVLSAEAGRNTIYAYWPKPDGAGYSMKRHNLISSLSKDNTNYQWNNDIADKSMWFRPSDVCFGTDGAMYIADWYDPIVGGHAMHDTVGYGRIVRIYPQGKKLSNSKIDIRTDEGKLKALMSPAINVRNIGYESLVHLPNLTSTLSAVLNNHNPFIQARAMYVLSTQNQDQVLSYASDPNENKRIAAFKALRTNGYDMHELLDLYIQDASPRVLKEAAIALRDIPYDQSKKYIKILIDKYPDDDRWYNAAFGIACDGKEEKVFNECILPNLSTTKWSDKSIHQVFTLHPLSSVKHLENQIPLQSNEVKSKLITAIAFVNDTSAVYSMLSLSNSKDSLVSSQAFWWLNFRKTNDWKNLIDWSKVNTSNLSKEQKDLLQWQETVLNSKNENEKIKAGIAMATSAEGGRVLISLSSNGIISGKLRDTISKVIINNPDAGVRAMASDIYWRRTEKKSHQYSIEMISKMQADISNGKVKFVSACMSCHKRNNTGKEIGPDLTTIAQKLDARSLTDAIINPSASIAFGYELSSLKTKKNEDVIGFIIADGASISIKDITGQVHTIEKSDIKEKKSLSNSLMPPAHQLNLSDRDVADIIGYLKN